MGRFEEKFCAEDVNRMKDALNKAIEKHLDWYRTWDYKELRDELHYLVSHDIFGPRYEAVQLALLEMKNC